MTDEQRTEQESTTEEPTDRVEDLEVGEEAAEDVQGGTDRRIRGQA